MTRVDLSSANWDSRSRVESANFSNANLTHSNFSSANLENVNFSNCNLSHSSFRSAKLNEANLSSAKCDHCDFSMSELRKAKLQGTDLSHSEFTSIDVCGTDLTVCNLSRVFLEDEFSCIKCDGDTRWPNGTRTMPIESEILEYLRSNPRALRKLERKNEKMSRELRRK